MPIVSKDQRRDVAKERNNQLAAARKAEADRVQKTRAVTRARRNLRRQAEANAAVAAMQAQIAYSKNEKEAVEYSATRPAEVTHWNTVKEELRRMPEGVQPITPEHFMDHQTARIASAPTAEEMAKFFNAANIDAEERYVHLTNLSGGKI
jgi:hypothetical protein